MHFGCLSSSLSRENYWKTCESNLIHWKINQCCWNYWKTSPCLHKINTGHISLKICLKTRRSSRTSGLYLNQGCCQWKNSWSTYICIKTCRCNWNCKFYSSCWEDHLKDHWEDYLNPKNCSSWSNCWKIHWKSSSCWIVNNCSTNN